MSIERAQGFRHLGREEEKEWFEPCQGGRMISSGIFISLFEKIDY
jgi:hypothetical protein